MWQRGIFRHDGGENTFDVAEATLDMAGATPTCALPADLAMSGFCRASLMRGRATLVEVGLCYRRKNVSAGGGDGVTYIQK